MLLELEEWLPAEVRWPPGLEEPMTCVVAMLGTSVGGAGGDWSRWFQGRAEGWRLERYGGELGGGLGRAEDAAGRRDRGTDGGYGAGERAEGVERVKVKRVSGGRDVACCVPPATVQRASPNGEIPRFILSPAKHIHPPAKRSHRPLPTVHHPARPIQHRHPTQLGHSD